MQLNNTALKMDGFQAKPSKNQTENQALIGIYPWILTFGILIGLALHLWHTPIFLESMDAVLFSQGLERYSLPELRPQWPGYAVYIWLGKLIHLFLSDRIATLHLISTVSISLCAWPIAALSYHWRRSLGSSEHAARAGGLLAAVLWLVLPLGWLAGTEIDSDSLGLLLALTYVICLVHAQKMQRWELFGVAGLIASAMVGSRLSYLVLILSALPLIWPQKGLKKGWAGLGMFALGFTVGCCAWLGWQVWMDGSGYFSAMKYHLAGHYQSWGGGLNTDLDPETRPTRAISTLLFYGLGTVGTPESGMARILVSLSWLGLLIWGVWQYILQARGQKLFQQAALIFWIWVLGYTTWAYISHDVELERYWFPVLAALVVFLAWATPTKRWLWIVPTVGILATLILSWNWSKLHQDSPHVEVQAGHYLSERAANQARLFFLTSPVLIKSYAPNLNIISVKSEREISYLATKSPLTENYIILAGKPTFLNDWQPVAYFCRSPTLGTRTSTAITLYLYHNNWQSHFKISSPLACQPVTDISSWIVKVP